VFEADEKSYVLPMKEILLRNVLHMANEHCIYSGPGRVAAASLVHLLEGVVSKDSGLRARPTFGFM
jgi:hypothetical protein